MLIDGHDMTKIRKLKYSFNKFFEMKDLCPVKQILSMKVILDRKNKKLWLSQEKYIEKVLKIFNMSKVKIVETPLVGHFKLGSSLSPTSEEEKEEMKSILYASVVDSLMYAMVCTRPDIAHVVEVVSQFLSNSDSIIGQL